MIRGITKNGGVLVGFTRSTLEHLLAGDMLTSPAFDGIGPTVYLVFAETDKELREVLVRTGAMRPDTPEFDRRRS